MSLWRGLARGGLPLVVLVACAGAVGWAAWPTLGPLTGLVAPAPSARNSALMQARRTTFSPSSAFGNAPSRPNSEGR